MDTTQLVLRVQNGDEQALNELYYNCYKLPYSSALTLTKNEADSYEIMQDSFRDVFSRIDLSLSLSTGFRIYSLTPCLIISTA